jgi:hypothetical protein
MERRFSEQAVTVETRDDGKRMIVGYGAVFYRENDAATEYRIFPDLIERIAPTAFNRALEEGQDVRGLFNHDPSQILGRTKSGTMRLSVDKVGLKYEIDLPDTTMGRDVSTSIGRGDLSGSSFAFRPAKGGQRFTQESGVDVRTLTDLDIRDTGPVVYPAYEGSTVGLRAIGDDDGLREQYEAWKARRETVKADLETVQARMAELEAGRSGRT